MNIKILTSEYCWLCLNKEAVQISLYNCSLQKMEELSANSTLEDVRRDWIERPARTPGISD